MADDFGLISDAERQHVLDDLRRKADAGTISQADLSDRTTRVHAAQTHAGLEAILQELPSDPPWQLPQAPPPPVGPGLPWWQRPVVVVVAAMVAGVGMFTAAIVGASADDDGGDSASRRTIIELPPAEQPTTTTRPTTTTTRPPTTTTSPLIVDPAFNSPATVLKVGQDIQPGRYMTSGQICYWERVHSFGGGLDDVIVNGLGPKVIVDVQASDAGLRSEGCGPWVPYAPLATQVTTFGDGDWLAGSDIPPGTYSAPGSEGCWWSSRTDFTHDIFEGVIDDHFSSGDFTVTLRSGNGFTTQACGTWTKVG